MVRTFLNEADDKALIKITPAWMEEKFNEMNRLLFNSQLKACRFSLFTEGKGSRGGTLGWFKVAKGTKLRKNHVVDGRGPMYVNDSWGDKIWLDEENFVRYAKPEIQLNGNYNWTEKAALSTLVHEMCHYYACKDGWYPIQAHGPVFRRIAEMVSRKSNEFFTVERLAKAEQMEQMAFTDEFMSFNNKKASKGIHFFKIELATPERGRSGQMYKFAYAIPAATILDSYAQYLTTVPKDRFAKIYHCVTTDGNIGYYRTTKNVGGYRYAVANTIEEVMANVGVDSMEEVKPSDGDTQMSEPWYVFRMKYITPLLQRGKVYPYGYFVVKPMDFYQCRNYLINGLKHRFDYAEYAETYDPKITGWRPNKIKDQSWYIATTNDVVPGVKLGPYSVVFDSRGLKESQEFSESDLRYMVSETLQRLKRRTITKK